MLIWNLSDPIKIVWSYTWNTNISAIKEGTEEVSKIISVEKRTIYKVTKEVVFFEDV